ncbi:MAG: cobalamin-dependent protein [Candidatus Omnitrophica bacterium]|nr:cobalamin-dependent protein [Candidatus Omnitrophota bacterium]MDD5591855.1 cobalamin-dependent protein [Candidatus Omnitrophota bacterium]
MKILLIQPPFTIFKTEAKKCHPPLGLAYLAAVLKDAYQVAVLDALAEGYEKEASVDMECLRYGLSFEDIGKRVKDFSPDAVGISCLFSSQSENVHAICKIVKEIDKRIVTILGGAHCSAVPADVLRDENVDFIVIGEGEITLKVLLEHLQNKRSIRDIEGIGFRYNDSVKINPRINYLENLDSLPFPYWEIFPLEEYFRINNPHGSPAKKTPFLPMITSRGCPFECIFCSIHNLWGRNYRKRSAGQVVSEISYLFHKFGVKELLFEDDNLTLDKNRAESIFKEMIRQGFNLLWSVPNGVALQTLDDGMLELMKQSGCYRISIGIESGDEHVLKNIIKKPLMLSQVKPIINKAEKLKIETAVFFVVGLPGETREHLNNTFKLAKKLQADNVNFFFATPLPGTRLLELCKEKKLIPSEFNYKDLKADYPSFSTENFSTDGLYSLVMRQRLMIQMRYLIRHPFKVFYKILLKLIYDPKYFIKYKLQLQNKLKSKKDSRVITKDTGFRYGFLWSTCDNMPPPKKYHLDFMQETIPEKITRGSCGLEIGCGCGWDAFAMAKNNPMLHVIGMDISDGVYVAAKLSRKLNNVNIIKGSAVDIPLRNGVCDFVYSFGVLHHIPDYKKAFLEIGRVLKKGSPCFLYLYEDHAQNLIKYLGIKLINIIRKFTLKIPPRILYLFSCLISPVFVIIFSYPARFFKRYRITYTLYEKIPFNFGRSLFSLRGDIYDRFSAPVEHRFSRDELYRIFDEFNFYNIQITKIKATAGWVAWGYKQGE